VGTRLIIVRENILQFVVAAACVQVVLRNSEKAGIIYREAKEGWGRPDCQTALMVGTIPFASMLAAVEAVRSKKMSDWTDPLADMYERYKDSEDFKYLIRRVNEFIKVGFNSEANLDEDNCYVLDSLNTQIIANDDRIDITVSVPLKFIYH